MSPAKFKAIREQLGLTQSDLAEFLGLSGQVPISHFETGFRTPSPLIAGLMSYLGRLSVRRAADMIEELGSHVHSAKKSKRSVSRG